MTNVDPAVICIDDSQGKILDDGVAVVHHQDGTWILHVGISDPTLSVRPETPDDLMARARGFSSAEPLFSQAILNSTKLSVHRKSDMVRVKISLNAEGAPIHISFAREKGKPKACLSFESVRNILNDQKDPLYEEINNLRKVAEILVKRRRLLGRDSLKIQPASLSVLIGREDKEPLAVKPSAMLAEINVLTNMLLTQYACDRHIPLLFLNQSNGLGSGMASFGLVPCGHQDLKISAYAQFSSPLRRYTDFLNWRHLLEGGKTGNLSEVVQNLNKLFLMQQTKKPGKSTDPEVTLVEECRLQSLRQRPFLKVISLCLKAKFVPFSLDKELLRRLDPKRSFSSMDAAAVLGSGKALFKDESLGAVLAWVGTSRRNTRNTITALQEGGFLVSKPELPLDSLEKDEAITLLEEKLNIPHQAYLAYVEKITGDAYEGMLRQTYSTLPEPPNWTYNTKLKTLGQRLKIHVSDNTRGVSKPSEYPLAVSEVTWYGIKERLTTRAQGPSRKAALDEACRLMLVKLGILDKQSPPSFHGVSGVPASPFDEGASGILGERAQHWHANLRIKPPKYDANLRCHTCQIVWSAPNASFIGNGSGQNANEAKNNAIWETLAQMAGKNGLLTQGQLERLKTLAQGRYRNTFDLPVGHTAGEIEAQDTKRELAERLALSQGSASYMGWALVQESPPIWETTLIYKENGKSYQATVKATSRRLCRRAATADILRQIAAK